MPKRSNANDLSEEARRGKYQEKRASAEVNEPAAESEGLDAEIERRIVEDSQSVALDRVSQPPLAQPAPATFALSASDAELDDAALAAAIFVPPLD